MPLFCSRSESLTFMLPGQHNTAEPSTTAEEETLTNQNKLVEPTVYLKASCHWNIYFTTDSFLIQTQTGQDGVCHMSFI